MDEQEEIDFEVKAKNRLDNPDKKLTIKQLSIRVNALECVIINLYKSMEKSKKGNKHILKLLNFYGIKNIKGIKTKE